MQLQRLGEVLDGPGILAQLHPCQPAQAIDRFERFAGLDVAIERRHDLREPAKVEQCLATQTLRRPRLRTQLQGRVERHQCGRGFVVPQQQPAALDQVFHVRRIALVRAGDGPVKVRQGLGGLTTFHAQPAAQAVDVRQRRLQFDGMIKLRQRQVHPLEPDVRLRQIGVRLVRIRLERNRGFQVAHRIAEALLPHCARRPG